MKYHIFFITSLVLVSSCTAMHTLKIAKELPALKHKHYISFLTDEELIIQGKETWNIIDNKTNKTIKTLDSTPCPAKIDIHPNKKVFMILGHNKIKIYDTKTKEQIKEYISNQSIQNAQFDPLHNEIIYIMTSTNNPMYQSSEYQDILKYNYRCNYTIPLRSSTPYHKFCVHPLQPLLCHLNRYILYQTNNAPLILPFISDNFFYSPDGSIILTRNFSDILIINSSTLKIEKHLQRNTYKEYFEDIKMYSNNLLTVLSVFNADTECWNERLQIKFYNITDLLPNFQSHPNSMFDPKPQPIAQTEKIEIDVIWPRQRHTLSFSPNKKQAMIAFHDKTFLFDIPFEIMYEPETKKRLSHLLFVLRNCKIELPSELINLIAHISLETYKR